MPASGAPFHTAVWLDGLKKIATLPEAAAPRRKIIFLGGKIRPVSASSTAAVLAFSDGF